tara:strand:- start:40944 stop:41876 length:933 start_codon:yes stop_codon:yes gene_type:complete
VDAFTNNYPGCSQITHGLRIDGSEITNLNGLEGITSVTGGAFSILTTLSLESLHGLHNIETIDTDFYINYSGIFNFTGLESLTYMRNISVSNNSNLVSFEGLENLEFINGFIHISENESLASFNGLNNLNGIDDYIDIGNNQSLISLDGLENLQSVPYVRIFSNNTLVSIAGLENIEPTQFVITDNLNLPQCAIDPVCQQININPNFIVVENNSVGCNTIPEVEAGCLLSTSEVNLLENFAIYPNPASKMIRIARSEDITLKSATIYSMLGEKLLYSSQDKIEVSNLSEGIYFIQIITDKGKTIKKFVKE